MKILKIEKNLIKVKHNGINYEITADCDKWHIRPASKRKQSTYTSLTYLCQDYGFDDLSGQYDKLFRPAFKKVWIYSNHHITSSYHSGEQWGEWVEDWFFTVDNASIDDKTNEYGWDSFPVYSEAEIKDGAVVYVLWIQYSTSNSFGQSKGNGEVLAVFTDKEFAKRAYDKWDKETSSRCNGDNYSISTELAPDYFVLISNPANGYFENKEDLKLTALFVGM
jgi:hypothetical protein